jgi:archaellum component FlaG (FlaF/FlaG flagellin family)
LFNYPNPFNNTTTIVYSLPESGNVKLTITNMYGKTIHTLVDGVQEAGNYTVTVDPSIVKLAPGVYLYQVELQGDNDTYVKTNKMIFTR